MSMKLRNLVATALGATIALGSLPALAAPGEARVGTATLDPRAQALLIPFQGPAPGVKLQKLAPRQFVADLVDARLAKEEVQGQAVGGKPLMAGWSLDEQPTGHTVRVRFTLKQDVDPNLQVEQLGHVLRLSLGAPRFRLGQRGLPANLTFQKPHAPVALAMPTGVAMLPAHHGPAAVGAPHYDARRRCLVIPVAGAVDPHKLAVVNLKPGWAYLDLPGSRPTFSGTRYQEGLHQPIQRWVMAKRPNQDTTRLSFGLAAGTKVDLKLAGKELLVAVRPVAAPVAHRKPVALAAAPVEPAHVTPNFTRPYYDQARRGLVLPYTGETPLYRIDEQGGARAVVELKGVTPPASKLEQRFANHRLLASWQVQRDVANDTVKVALSFHKPGEVVVAVDPAKHQLLVIPQARVAGEAAPVAEGTLSAARLPAEGRQIFIPYAGHVPSYSIEQVSDTVAFVDFEGAKLEAHGVQYAQLPFHPTVSHWLLSERAAQHLVRLAVTLRQPGGVRVFQDRTNQRLVVELDGAEPTLGARARSQRPAEWPGEQRLVGEKAS